MVSNSNDSLQRLEEKVLKKVKTKEKEQRVLDKQNPLFEALRSLRRQVADEENKPPFMIFSDATLQDMVQKKPKTLQEMLSVSGVGQFKLEQYGARFLSVIKDG